MTNQATVRAIALSLDDVVEGTSYGTPAFYRRKKLFVRFLPRSPDVVIRMDMGVRDALVKAKPDKFAVTEHYQNYPWVIVRLAAFGKRELESLIASSHAYVATSQAASRPRTKRKTRSTQK